MLATTSSRRGRSWPRRSKYNRIVQHGTSSRSVDRRAKPSSRCSDGLIGDVYMARGLCYKRRDTIGRKPARPCRRASTTISGSGPRRKRDSRKNRFHYNWHWFWDYGNGDLGNQGIHQMDIARWGLGVKYPDQGQRHRRPLHVRRRPGDAERLELLVPVRSAGGARRMITFEVRHWITNHEAEIGTSGLGVPEPKKSANRPALGPSAGSRNAIGNIFYGSKGFLATGDEDAATYAVWLGRDQEKQPPVTGGSELAHYQNFIDCVVSRKQADLHAPIEEGHISCALVHLANACTGWGERSTSIPETQTVIGDDEAAKLLRDGDRSYRAPFVIPEEV